MTIFRELKCIIKEPRLKEGQLGLFLVTCDSVTPSCLVLIQHALTMLHKCRIGNQMEYLRCC